MRVNRSISSKERRRYALDNLGGVDFTSSPLLCAPYRSPEAVNWIGDHGINRKRNGWEQVMDTFKPTDPDGYVGIHAIIPVDQNNILVFANQACTLMTLYADGWKIQANYIDKYATGRVQHWRSGNKIYIVGTLKYLCYDTDYKAFTTVIPYVPTTTINIGHDGKENDVRSVLDAPNLLTQKRKNTLEGVKLEGTEAKSKWILDGKILGGTLVTIDAEVKVTDGSTELGYYIENVRIENKDSEGKIGTTLSKVVGAKYTEIGSIMLDAGDGRGAIVLKDSTTPPIEGQANITVTFQADVADKSRYINGCTFGTLFGVGGVQDRLFLSGNSAYPNVVFFSEANDFTYFPDTYTETLGTSGTPVKGFLRLSDSVLAVLKEDGVYYQSGEYRTEYDDAGNIKKITPVFSITAGSINESAVNPYAVANFGGDNVFLSRNGVFSIEPTSNVLTNTRTARERSYPITARMLEFDAANAVMCTHGQRLYLSDGEVCYVADSAYKYTPTGSESFSYEWWYWDHIPARVFAEVNGELWFGTEDGRVCRFTDGYTDTTYDYTANGDIGRKQGTFWHIVINQEYLGKILTVGKRVRITTDGWKDNNDNDPNGVDLYVHSLYTLDEYTADGKLTYSCVKFTYYKDATEDEWINFKVIGDNTILRVYNDTPVVAEWVSPPLDFGNDSLSKTLFSLTVTAETGKNSVLSFGCETHKRAEEMVAAGLDVFSFEDMSFLSFSFENGFQTSYTVRARDRNFNFLRFLFRSDGDRACAVHRISALYKINKYNKGVV